MAAVPLFRDINMAAVTSRENTLVLMFAFVGITVHNEISNFILFKIDER